MSQTGIVVQGTLNPDGTLEGYRLLIWEPLRSVEATSPLSGPSVERLRDITRIAAGEMKRLNVFKAENPRQAFGEIRRHASMAKVVQGEAKLVEAR